MPLQTFQIIVHGRVQGVSYRYYTIQKAKRLGITGWVKNRTDGAVEIVAQASNKELEEFVTWCREGSPAAEVERIEVEEIKREEKYEEFEVRYDK